MEAAKKHLQIIDTSTEVSHQEKTFLVHGVQRIPIHAECASKYSLFFRYLENQTFTDTSQPVRLLIQNNGDSFELGPCKVLSSPQLNGYAGRLVFTEDIYDIQRLLLDNKVINLKSAFNELPLLLDRKCSVRETFKNFTSDLAYDLSVYKKIFDDLDAQYYEEPDEVKIMVQKAIIESEGRKFMEFFHETVKELNAQVANFNDEEHQLHGFYFRKQLWNFIMCCALMSRTNLKPRGYAGDSAMMKMIYRNDYEGDTTFCKLMQKYTVGVPAAQSVRNRRTLIMNMLRRFRRSNGFAPDEKINVLSVACGPAFELEDILSTSEDLDKYYFTLLDQDQRALNEAARFVAGIEQKFDAAAAVNYANISVRIMLGKKPFKTGPDKFHFIYSMGLFDYLTTPIARAITNKLYQFLLPGGELVIGNFHVSNPSRRFMEYWGDWNLIHRNEEEFTTLLQDASPTRQSVKFEETGSQMFLDVRK